MNERKRRSQEILESMIWLVAYKKPVTISEINKKVYPPKNERHEPTSKWVYKIIKSLIDKGYITRMFETSDAYVRSSTEPLLEIIDKGLREKKKYLTKEERKILSEFLYEAPIREIIGLFAEKTDMFVDKEINGYELVVDCITCLLFGYEKNKKEMVKKGASIPPSTTVNLNDYKRRVHRYVKSPQSIDLTNMLRKSFRKISTLINCELPSIESINFDAVMKVLLALPDQVTEKLLICMKEEYDVMSFVNI